MMVQPMFEPIRGQRLAGVTQVAAAPQTGGEGGCTPPFFLSAGLSLCLCTQPLFIAPPFFR